MDENMGGVDTENTTEDADLDTADESGEETIEDVKARLEAEQAARAKAEDIADSQKIRAEKAEREAKKLSKEPTVNAQAPKSSTAGDISLMDSYALLEAKVPKEDIADVKEYADLKGISVSEALNSNVVKAILSDKAEARNVAAATNTGTVRRTTAKVSDETLLSNASKGVLPDDPEALAEARMRLQKAK